VNLDFILPMRGINKVSPATCLLRPPPPKASCHATNKTTLAPTHLPSAIVTDKRTLSETPSLTSVRRISRLSREAKLRRGQECLFGLLEFSLKPAINIATLFVDNLGLHHLNTVFWISRNITKSSLKTVAHLPGGGAPFLEGGVTREMRCAKRGQPSP
jgi:hypothetical protein